MTRSPIDDFLDEQGRLDTPVVRFARGQASPDVAARVGVESVSRTSYSDLIPLSAPGPGEQYAFQVDLDSCTGCKACVASCHALNGLDEGETWRDIGTLVSPDPHEPFMQVITTACHHCADPGCLNGCPVLAYDKDPVTGIVRHLDDQCIGCNYCVLMCPYDVPKYNARLGIVRKCDLCHGRLAQGEAPACVQGCPTEAISIISVPVRKEGGRPVADTGSFLPGAPDPRLTQPTTRYVSRHPLPAGLVGVSAGVPRAQPAHVPLGVMLVLMEAAAGCTAAETFTRGAAGARLGLLGWAAGAMGLAASVLHLGRPERAWRIFLGVRRSWLSREAILFGAWFGAASAGMALSVFAAAGRTGHGRAGAWAHRDWAGILVAWIGPGAQRDPASVRLAVAAALLGVAGLVCSAMIYVVTGRTFWRASETFPRFFGGAAALGLAGFLACGTRAGGAGSVAVALLGALLLARVMAEFRVSKELGDPDDPPTRSRMTARLLAGPLRSVAGLRAGAAAAGVFLALAVVAGRVGGACGWVAFGLLLIGELAERNLFFRAVDGSGMPGVTHGGAS